MLMRRQSEGVDGIAGIFTDLSNLGVSMVEEFHQLQED